MATTITPDAGVPSVAPPATPHAGRIDRLRVRHLRLLERIAELGSLSAAAQALSVSQPGATKMLQELESAFGCHLIGRSARGGQLTPAGAHALSRLRVVLGALDAAAAGLAEQAEVPLLRLGLLPLIAVRALPQAIQAMATAGTVPRMKLREGTVDGLLALLLKGELDCVLGRLEAAGANAAALDLSQLCVTPLWEEGLGIAAAQDHPLAGRGALELNDLASARWALPPRDTNTRRFFDQRFMDTGRLPPVPHIESISFHTNLALAETGAVVTIAPRSAILQYQAHGVIRELTLAQAFPTASVVALTMAGGPAASGVEPLIDILRRIEVTPHS